MRKNKKLLGKQFNDRVLNAFALMATLLPIISIGYFVQKQFFDDPRSIMPLSSINATATPRLFEEPLVSVTFDDGWESIYVEAAPLLQKYNIRTTQYIMPGEFHAYNYMSLGQAKSLKDAGHEIMSHTMTHQVLTEATPDQLKYELEESKKALLKLNLTHGPVHFAAPESATDLRIDINIMRTYASSRNTFSDLGNGIDENDINVKTEVIGGLDQYNIIGYSVRPTTTPNQIRDALRYAKNNNGWLVLVYHQIDESRSEYAVDTSTFESHLKMIVSSGVKAAPLGEVMSNSKVNL